MRVSTNKNNIKVYLKKNCKFMVNDNEQRVISIRTREDVEDICGTDSADMLFDVKDNDHQRGKFGFFSDNSTQLMVNQFNVVPLKCTPLDTEIDDQVYSAMCSRQNYAMSVGGFKNNWTLYDDAAVIDKMPSKWREIKDLNFKFSKGIVQESDIKTTNGSIATWLQLNKSLLCKDGNFFSMFKVENNGKFALVFRREDNNRFW